MGVIRMLNRRGDTPTAWKVKDKKSLSEAEERFAFLLKDGFTIVKDPTSNSPGTIIREFDPNANEIIAIPQLVGG